MSNHTEAPVSANIKLYSEKGADILLTVRSGATNEEVQNVLDTLAHALGYAAEKYHLSSSHNVTAQSVPELKGHAPGISGLSFQTELLEMSKNKGKTYWKIKGHPFMQYGVTIWPEVLEAAGYDMVELEKEVSSAPNWELSFGGYTAHYVEKTSNGKTFPDKITKLEGQRVQAPTPPQQAQPEQPPMPEEPPF